MAFYYLLPAESVSATLGNPYVELFELSNLAIPYEEVLELYPPNFGLFGC